MSSCLKGREEYWINRDGSGKLEASYTLPAIAINKMGGPSMLRSKIEGFFTAQGKVSMTHLAITPKNDSICLDLKISFQNAADIVDLLSGNKNNSLNSSQPDAIDQLLGTMHARRDGIAVAVERNIDLRQLFPSGILSPSSTQVRNNHLEYIIHLPASATRSNAHLVTDSGKTLQWKYPLSLALKDPLHMELIAPIPIPHWLLLLLLLLLALFPIGYRIKKFRSAKKIIP